MMFFSHNLGAKSTVVYNLQPKKDATTDYRDPKQKSNKTRYKFRIQICFNNTTAEPNDIIHISPYISSSSKVTFTSLTNNGYLCIFQQGHGIS